MVLPNRVSSPQDRILEKSSVPSGLPFLRSVTKWFHDLRRNTSAVLGVSDPSRGLRNRRVTLERFSDARVPMRASLRLRIDLA
jgi:hypothetical protein